MKCPKCQFDNREGVKFCEECGAKLPLKCPQCGADIVPTAKFCGECGYNLTLPPEPVPQELSFEEKLDKAQRDLPDGLTEKVLAQRDTIEGERKQVTVMFCDIADFASLSDRLRPDDVYSIMDEILEILIHRVHKYGGTVNKATGMMALFGAPIAIEDAPQRAIRAALSIHHEIARFNDRIKHQRNIPPIKMRIGIHTGPVVVSKLGDDLRVELATEGDTVDLASRMQELAKPGTTYVTEDTFKLTQGYFRFEAIGDREFKGKELPAKAYLVIAPSTRRTRFDVNAEHGLTPFVGRERELELLLDGFELARSGKGRVFSIMGEAGVGKSRLLYEFRKAITHEDIFFLEGKCLSYSQTVAYHPIIDIVKSGYDIDDNDDDDQIRDKLKRGLKIMGIDEASSLPYLLELLSVKDSGIDKIPMSPEARKDRTWEAIRQGALKGSEIRPLVMFIEDLHWIDRSSEEYLKFLLDSIPGVRCLLIFAYRPEFVPTWGSKPYHNQVNLNRLSNQESIAMMNYLLGTEEIEPALEELILEKTEGIPFFIEEMIKSLTDLEIIERKDYTWYLAKDLRGITIPNTIHDVIMARVDSLPDAAKGVLQTGAVIEREFSHDLIKKVAGMPEPELLSYLSALKDSELLYERGVYPQSTYIFKNALTHDVVYDSILDTRKKRLHVEIGDAIEEMNRENLEEYCETIAVHYITGENFGKGAEYCRMAANKSEDNGSFTEAIAHCEKRLDCLDKLPQTEDIQKRIIDTRTTLGLYYTQLLYYIEAKEAVDPVVELAEKLDYKRRMSQIYTIMGGYYYQIDEDLPKGFRYLEAALEIAEELNDVLSLVMVRIQLGMALNLDCQFEKAMNNYEKVMEINMAANSLWGTAVAKQLTANVYYSRGNINLAFNATSEAVRIAEESGDIYSRSLAYWGYGYSYYGRGLFEEAEEHLLKSAELCKRANSFGIGGLANLFAGHVYFELGQYKKAQEHYNEVISQWEYPISLKSWVNLSKVALARAKVMNNEKDIDIESLYRYEDEIKFKWCKSMTQPVLGEILLNIDDRHINEAEEWIRKAIETNKTNGSMFDLAMDHALYGELLKRKGDLLGAKENLVKAIEIYKEYGSDGWVKKVEEELAKIKNK